MDFGIQSKTLIWAKHKIVNLSYAAVGIAIERKKYIGFGTQKKTVFWAVDIFAVKCIMVVMYQTKQLIKLD